MATQVSVPGGGNHPLIFTVTGTSTINYATAFQNAVIGALNAGNLTINNLSNGSQHPATGSAGTPVIENVIVGGGPQTFNLGTGGQYTAIDVGSATTVFGSAAGADSILAAGDATYVAAGAGNQVTFIDGTNTYFGSSVAGSAADTITGGAGYDTINTGVGSAVVFSGSGHTLVNLNDTVGGDIAYLGDGTATVNSYGLNDTVVAAAPGQTIFGGPTGNLLVAIESNNSTLPGAISGHDAIIAGASTVTVFDSVGGNSIFGGAGNLTFVGGAAGSPISDSIVAGTGTTNVFGAANNNIVVANTSASGSITLVAGLGNETLNGANAANFNFFGSNDTSASATVVTGAGTDNLVAGHGNDVFDINTVGGGGANVNIYDFTAADSVNFLNQEQTESSNNGTASGDNYVIKLSDNTTVTFVGITSLPGHNS